MLKRKNVFAVAAAFVVVISVGLVMAIETPSSWVNTTDPTVQKIINLPDNTLPVGGNLDCENITSRIAGTSTMVPDCVVPTAFGLAGNEGVTFIGASDSIRVVPPWPYNGLRPIANQGMFYTYTSAQVIGLYMHFYNSIRDKMPPVPETVNGRLQYTLTKVPDRVLTDAAGRRLPINTNTLAFSSDGNWMVADIPFEGFVRINMATFDIVPFAPSLNAGNDYGGYAAEVAITNDGRHVAIKPSNAAELRVYDLGTCNNPTLPVSRQQPKCQSRDYWPYLTTQVSGPKALYKLRFTNDMQVSFTAVYAYLSASQFKVAQYVLTAPGENVSGIEYLGMGDSFASGQGAYSYIDGTDTANNTCHLSSLSYPFLLSTSLFNSGHSVACSGARIKDVTGNPKLYGGQNVPNRNQPELDRLNLLSVIYKDYSPGYLLQNEFVQKYRPQTLTLSIGGNDIGFSDVVKQCVMPRIKDTTCYPTYEDQQELVKRITAVGDKLKTTYKTISGPGRTVYVIGYPHIVVEGGNCAANVHLDSKEIKLFVGLTDTLNEVIKRAAESAGAKYVDVSQTFVGHRMCETKSSQVAVNGFTAGNDEGIGSLKFIGAESYHPNALGHELLKQAILRQTSNLRNVAGVPTNTTLVTSDIASTLPQSDALKTGRSLNLTINDTDITPDVVALGVLTPITLNTSTALLKPAASYTMRLDDAPAAIATITTDTSGSLGGSIVLPPNTTCGSHVVHLYGQNIANQPVDIFKVIYVPASNGDCNNDGQPDTTASCGVLAKSGMDSDKDGIDDACDGYIADPPTYKVYITGSSIHAVKP